MFSISCCVYAEVCPGKPLLHLCAAENEVLPVKRLLEYGLDANSRDIDGNTPLCWAAMHSDDICRLLIEHGADVNAKNKAHKTPLHTAARAGSYSACCALLEAGANVNVKTKDGDTPLHYAAEYATVSNNHDVYNLLSELGAKDDVKNKAGKTPFDLDHSQSAEWARKYVRSHSH